MGRLIEEDDDFVDDDFGQSADGLEDDTDLTLSGSPKDEPNRLKYYTERRRRIEDLIEAARMRDELGLYDDDLFAS